MKNKHNKKRNTAFLYEALIRELTKSIVTENNKKKKTILNILKQYYNNNSILSKELELYKVLLETKNEKKEIAEKILNEVKKVYFSLGNDDIFQQQTELIKTVNKNVSPKVFSNFVPFYKDLATIKQIFDMKTPVKTKVLLESTYVEKMSETKEALNEELIPVDNLVYKTFVKKFNSEYTDLLKEQRELLNHYIASFADNGIELKVFLNEEIERLKEGVKKALNESKEINEDQLMLEKTKEVLSILKEFRNVPTLEENNIEQILKIQSLIEEVQNGN